ncbi:MAG: DUF2703 domain-containing protein [Acidobacteria bacterium]|nr:DUF2703 domain-containing protein [Acidobacteriota bacterium]
MGKENTCGNGGCGCSNDAAVSAGETATAKTAKKTIEIEFLYLDLNVCEQCRGSESNLEEALSDVSLLLEKTGVTVNLTKTHVESFEQALALDFISSPTIRINGRDAAFEVAENHCQSCSRLSGTETYCRVWKFEGEEFSTAPKSLVIEAVLREIYGPGETAAKPEVSAARRAKSHDNLKRFFEGRIKQGESPAETADAPARTAETKSAGGCGCS